jgi:hypothetical protein
VPICALAFFATWLIPHVELKRWTTPSPEAGKVPVAPVVGEAADVVAPAAEIGVPQTAFGAAAQP